MVSSVGVHMFGSADPEQGSKGACSVLLQERVAGITLQDLVNEQRKSARARDEACELLAIFYTADLLRAVHVRGALSLKRMPRPLV